MGIHHSCRSIFSLLFLVSINSGIAEAQVVPDGTLPTNVEQLEMIRKITGGERVGDNLFHSFEEFSIPEGMSAIFENALDFQKDLEFSRFDLVSLPDFYTPRCQNPDRARISIDSGKYLAEAPDNYFSSPGTLSGDLPPELSAKLEQMKQELDERKRSGFPSLFHSRRESNPSPEPEPEQKSNILWKPGEPILNATEVIETSDGRIFLVLPDEKPNKELICPQKQ